MTEKESRIFLDLRFFDETIKSVLAKHIPYRPEELNNKMLMPSIYQTLANELSFYRHGFKVTQSFPTRVFRTAYFQEDRSEITDELFLSLRDYIYEKLFVTTIKNGLNIKMVSYNQWLVWHYESKK